MDEMRDMLQRTGRLCTAGTEEEKVLLWRMQLVRFVYCEVLCSGAFAKLRKATICFVMSGCLSVRMEHLDSQWKDFHEIRSLRIFRKSVEKIQVSLKSDNNNGNLRENQYALLFLCRLIPLRMTDVWQTSCREIQNTHFMYNNFFKKSCRYKIMWENMVQPDRLQNEERNDLYSSPNIFLVIKSRRMRWAGHVARMRQGRWKVYTYRVFKWKTWGKSATWKTQT